MKRQRTELLRFSELNLDLPDDCWEHVFRFMNEDGEEENDNRRRHYLNSLSLVSKQFHSISNHHKLYLRICHPTLPFLPRLFHRFTNLTTLDFSDFHGELNNLLIQISTTLPTFNQLTSLNLSNQSSLPAIGLRAFSSAVKSTLTSLICSRLGVFNYTHDFKLISDCFPFLQQLDLSYPRSLNHDDHTTASAPPSLFKLRKVNLSHHIYIHDEFIFNLFKNCNFLEEAIMLLCRRITNHGITSALSHRPNFKSLILTPLYRTQKNRMIVTSDFIRTLTTSKAITCLDLSTWYISDHFLSSIQTLPLTTLGLGCCHGYTYSGILSFLSNCLSIQHLNLQDADFLTDHHVAELSSFLPRLLSINLCCCDMLTDSAFFALLRNCPSLTQIQMQYTSIGDKTTATANNSMDDSVVYPQFKSLWLAKNFDLEDDKLIMFASLFPNLQHLDLTHCSLITEQGIGQVLRTCRKIRHLNMSNFPTLTSLGIDNFELPNLEVLNLTNTRLRDEALYVISNSCPALLQLSLQLCKDITNTGVMHIIKNCTKLREIILDDCLKVHANIVASMVSLRPSLRKIGPSPDFPLTNRTKKLFSRHGCLLF